MTDPFSDPILNSAPTWPDLPALPGESAPAEMPTAPGLMPQSARRKGLSREQWLLLASAVAAMVAGPKRGGAGIAAGAAQGVQQNIAGRMQQQQMAEQAAYRQQQVQMQQQQAAAQARVQQSQEQARLAQERMRVYNLANETLARAETPEEYQQATRALYAESAAVPGLNIRVGTFEALHPFIDKRLEKWAKNSMELGIRQFGGVNEWLAAKPRYDTPEDYGPSQALDAQSLMRFLKVAVGTDSAGQPKIVPVKDSASVENAKSEARQVFKARFGRMPDPDSKVDEKAYDKLVELQINPPKVAAGGGDARAEPEVAPDPASQNILSQTGLGINAFRYLTGQASQLARDKVTRERAAREAQTWAREHNVDISTLPAQYKAQNDVLAANISRLNNTKIMEQELIGTVQNLQGVVKDQDLGRLRFANVARIWAGQEVNDDLAQQYAMHLSQLRNELTAYYGATQGRTGNNLTIEDKREAEGVIRNGISQGSLSGLQTAIENSTSKMGTVMQSSVDRAQKAVWSLFGVGQNYRGAVPEGDQSGIAEGTRKPIPSIPGGLAEYRNGKWIRVK